MSTIAECQTMASNEVIPTITLTVNKVWDKDKPVGNRGSLLTVFEASDATGKTRVSVFHKNAGEVPAYEGSSVTLTSQPGRNGLMAGVSIDEYNGKKNIKVGEARFVTAAGGAQPQQQAPQPQFVPEPTHTPQHPQQYAQQPPVQPQTAPPQSPAPVNTTELANTMNNMVVEWAALYIKYRDHLISLGVPAEEAQRAAAAAPRFASAYWFGKKSMQNPE